MIMCCVWDKKTVHGHIIYTCVCMCTQNMHIIMILQQLMACLSQKEAETKLETAARISFQSKTPVFLELEHYRPIN
jgi:mannitol/fructose-specific phosphotransferase system IIA component